MRSPAATSSPPASAIISTRWPTSCSAASSSRNACRGCNGARSRSPRPGSSALAGGALDQLWISLTLCVTFATYGLLRKIALVDAVAGLAIETALLFPLALAWLALAFRRRSADPGLGRHRDRAAGRRRRRFDDAAAAVHRRRPAPALFDARHAPVPRPDAAVPVRGVALRRAVRPRPCHRLRRDLDRAGAVQVALARAPRLQECPQPPE